MADMDAIATFKAEAAEREKEEIKRRAEDKKVAQEAKRHRAEDNAMMLTPRAPGRGGHLAPKTSLTHGSNEKKRMRTSRPTSQLTYRHLLDLFTAVM